MLSSFYRRRGTLYRDEGEGEASCDEKTYLTISKVSHTMMNKCCKLLHFVTKFKKFFSIRMMQYCIRIHTNIYS